VTPLRQFNDVLDKLEKSQAALGVLENLGGGFDRVHDIFGFVYDAAHAGEQLEKPGYQSDAENEKDTEQTC
jgi:hypothetical protein